MSKQILILPGDGIGQEIIAEAVKVLELANDKFNLNFELTHDLIGGASTPTLIALAPSLKIPLGP